MQAKCTLRKRYDKLVRKHRYMRDKLKIVQAVYGLGCAYDSDLYADYVALDDKLQSMAEALKIKRRRIAYLDAPGYEAFLLDLLHQTQEQSRS